MRFTLILLLSTCTVLAKTKLTTFIEIQKAVEKTRKTIATSKKSDLAIIELKKLKTIFDKTIEEYKTAYPQKGPKEEQEILTLYYAMEPVLSIKEEKMTKNLCEQKTHEVELMDGKTTDGKASIYAQPALDILASICPK